MADLLLGQVLSFTGDPFLMGPEAARHESHGAVLVEGGRIRATGPADALRAAYPQARVTDYGRALISAGFVDAHVHYPQTAIIASWGKRLIDWLNLYTFPEEMRFADPAYAEEIATRYTGLALAHGTTSFCTYSTIHPASVDTIFGAAQARNMRIWAGKTCMDRNAPEGLRDTAQSVLDGERHPAVGNALFFHTATYRPSYNNIQYVLTTGGNAFYERIDPALVTQRTPLPPMENITAYPHPTAQ